MDAPGHLGKLERFPTGPPPGIVEIVLTPFARIEGRAIRATTSLGVSGARVRVRLHSDFDRPSVSLHPGDGALEDGLHAAADSLGAFALPRVPPGVGATVTAEAEDGAYAEAAIDPLSPGETRTVPLSLDAPTRIVGRLPSSHPPGIPALVRLWEVSAGGRGFSSERARWITDGSSFEFRRVSAGPKLLAYCAQTEYALFFGFVPTEAVASSTVDTGEIPIANTDLLLTVVPEGDSPVIRDVRVLLHLLASGPPRRSYPVTVVLRSHVETLLRGLPHGELRITAFLADEGGKEHDPLYEPAELRHRLATSGERLVMRLPRKQAPREGTVVIALTKPPGVEADLVAPRALLLSGGRLARAQPMRGSGTNPIVLQRCAPGVYRLVVEANGYWADQDGVEIRAGEETRASVENWRPVERWIRGKVRAEDGTPVASASVRVEDSATGIWLCHLESGADGSVELPVVGPQSGVLFEARTVSGRGVGRASVDSLHGEGEFVVIVREESPAPPSPLSPPEPR
ncbi:MAG: hypothetical protein L0323_04680 [Planctomycetes bacterium]|nr:hypothetical protein [Planctomycetota bacterium]